MKTGIVKSFGHTWGFIKDDNDNKEYFVHFTNIIGEGYKTLDIGDVVKYELGPGVNGRIEALNVTLIGGSYE